MVLHNSESGISPEYFPVAQHCCITTVSRRQRVFRWFQGGCSAPRYCLPLAYKPRSPLRLKPDRYAVTLAAAPRRRVGAETDQRLQQLRRRGQHSAPALPVLESTPDVVLRDSSIAPRHPPLRPTSHVFGFAPTGSVGAGRVPVLI